MAKRGHSSFCNTLVGVQEGQKKKAARISFDRMTETLLGRRLKMRRERERLFSLIGAQRVHTDNNNYEEYSHCFRDKRYLIIFLFDKKKRINKNVGKSNLKFLVTQKGGRRVLIWRMSLAVGYEDINRRDHNPGIPGQAAKALFFLPPNSSKSCDVRDSTRTERESPGPAGVARLFRGNPEWVGSLTYIRVMT